MLQYPSYQPCTALLYILLPTHIVTHFIETFNDIPAMNPPPQAQEDPTTQPANILEDRLPAEVVDRIIQYLAEDHTADKSNHSSLCALQQTSKEMHMRVTPHIWKEYEGDLLGFYRLLRLLMPVTKEDLEISMPDPKREGHPLDWTYPTRILWIMSHINKLVYRPLIECKNWYHDLNPILVNFMQLQYHLGHGDSDLRLFAALQSLVMDASQYEGCRSSRDDIIHEPDDNDSIPQDWESDDTDDDEGRTESAYVIFQDQGKERKDLIAWKPSVEGFAVSFVDSFRPAQTCLRLGAQSSHLDYKFFQLEFMHDNITYHDYDISEAFRLIPTFTNPTITWSFLSPSETIVDRDDELRHLIATFSKVETLYFVKPSGQEQEDIMKKMMDESFIEGKANFIKTKYSAETFITKWEWADNGKDGIPRCKACGGESTLLCRHTITRNTDDYR